MLTVGLARLGRRRAAAVVKDGTILAVRSDTPGMSTAHGGGPVPLLRATIAAAGIDPIEVEAVSVASVDGTPTPEGASSPLVERVRALFQRAELQNVRPSEALARQAAAVADGNALLLVIGPQGPWSAFEHSDGRVRHLGSISGTAALNKAIRRVADLLGLTSDDWLAELSDLADSGPKELGPHTPFVRSERSGVAVDDAALGLVIEAARRDLPGDLSVTLHPHRAVQKARQALAQAALRQFATTIREVTEFQCAQTAQQRIAVAGEWFAVPGVNRRLREALGSDLHIGPLTGPEGLAVGAALPACGGPRAPLSHLAFGVDTDDGGIKQTLDNCRIDYVYEPRMERLILRAAALLAAGKQVAWVQGPTEIGGRSLGSRSVLADPGSRYARENVNVFLLGRRLDRPLMLSVRDTRSGELLEEPSCLSRFGEWQGTVRREHRQALGAAVDLEGRCSFHTVSPNSPSRLWQLLEACEQHHAIPGLLNVPLAGGNGGLASTPREAIQKFYSSAVDALVIGHFLLMKDYWLLRSDLG